MHIANFGFSLERIVMSLLLISSSQGCISLILVSDISNVFLGKTVIRKNPEESGKVRRSPETVLSSRLDFLVLLCLYKNYEFLANIVSFIRKHSFHTETHDFSGLFRISPDF